MSIQPKSDSNSLSTLL